MAKNEKVEVNTLLPAAEFLDGVQARATKKLEEHYAGKKVELTKVLVRAVFNSVLEELVAQVNEGRRVAFNGVGTFTSRYREERSYRNPASGESFTKPETSVLVFSASKTFKTSLEENKALTKAHKKALADKKKAKK